MKPEEAAPAAAASASTYWYNDQVRVVEDTTEVPDEELERLAEELKRTALDAIPPKPRRDARP